MKILVVADYPRMGHEFSAIFNERCVKALKQYCERIEVIAHRPYVPSFLSHHPRWRTWGVSRNSEVLDGISVHRPSYLQVPRLASAFWIDRGAFVCCRRTARELHQRIGFDAILSFDLFGAGGLAWRLGHDLGIPATGWATGSDVRKPAGSRLERVVTRAIRYLDLVFYQSRELFEIAAHLLGKTPEMLATDKHVVLARGIPEPPSISKTETRARVRTSLGIEQNRILVLSVGRIDREKGVFELLEVVSSAAAREPRICFVLLGSVPALDDTRNVEKALGQSPILRHHTKLVTACRPDQVWEYLCAADIFAFASHNEGMPNALLEAMAMGLPAVAFAIPPVLEIEGKTGALVPVPPLNSMLFAEALLRLAASADERGCLGEIARRRVMDRFLVRKNMAEALQCIKQIADTRRKSAGDVEKIASIE